ncbi:hypothetical protein GQ37_009595 [Janthinobacterium sp. BJB1]|nr:hypothetical protein GQ37_009595 [Janthinobacterium sp. BJB1]
MYLELIAETAKSQASLGQLPMQEIGVLDTYTGFSGLIIATAKISLLGEMDTVIKSRELLTVIQETLQRAMVNLVPISDLKTTRKHHQEEQRLQQNHCDRLLPIVEDNARRQVYGVEHQSVALKLKFHQQESERHGRAAEVVMKAMSSANQKFIEILIAENKAITQKIDLLVFSMRKELELVTSLEELQRSSAAMGSAAEASVQGMFESLKTAPV